MIADTRVRRRILHAYISAALVLGPAYAAFFALFGAWRSVGAPLLFTVLCVGAWFLARRDHCRAAVGALLGGLWLAPIWAVITTGGIHSPILVWLAPAPFMAGALVDRRAALGVGTASVLVVVALAVTRPFLAWPVEVSEGLGHELLAGLAGASAIGLLTYYGWATTKSFEDARAELVVAHGQAVEAALEVEKQHRDLRAVLDNVDQGLVRVGLDGTLLAGRSAALEAWFGEPRGERLWDYARPHAPRLADTLELAWSELADGFMPHEVVLGQLPGRIEVSGHTFSIAYRPIGTPMEAVMVVVSDVTAEVAHERSRARERDMFALFERVLADRAVAQSSVDELSGALERAARSTGAIRARELHTFKGTASVLGLEGLARVAHALEERLAEHGDLAPDDYQPVRAAWDEIRSRFLQWKGTTGEVTTVTASELAALCSELERSAVAAARARIARWGWERASARLEPLADAVTRLAPRLGRPAPRVTVDCAEVRVPPGLELVWSALSHAVRNALDHGIELPEERSARGKPIEGAIHLAVRERGGDLEIEVRDDGRGVDWERVAAKAAASGLPYATPADLRAALFADGVSTRDTADEISGRGVGLAALLDVTTQLGGSVDVLSEPGRGTALRVRLPATPRASLRPAA